MCVGKGAHMCVRVWVGMCVNLYEGTLYVGVLKCTRVGISVQICTSARVY